MNPHHLTAIIENAATREQAIRLVLDYHLAKDSRLPRVLAERLVDNYGDERYSTDTAGSCADRVSMPASPLSKPIILKMIFNNH